MKSSNRSSRLRKRSRKGYRRRLNKSSARTISPSKLWILLFVSLFPSQYLVAAGYVAHGVYKANVHEDPSQMNPMDYARFRRDAAFQLHTSVESLQHLARITNAAHLQTAISQNLPVDDFLAEILHLGDLKLSDVDGLDQSQFDAVVKDLEDLSKNLPTSDEAKKIEDMLVLVEKMGKNAEYFAKFDKFPGKDDFKTALAKVDDVKNIMAEVDKFKNTAAGILTDFKTVRNLPKKVDAGNLADASTRMTSILSYLNNLENYAKNFEVKKLIEAKKFGNNPNFLDLLVTEFQDRQKLITATYQPQATDLVWNNFKNLAATSAKVDESLSTFDTIEKIVTNRDKGHKQKYEYTAGFPAGSSDLKELQLSVSNGFIQKHISNSQIVIESLKSSFNPFVALTDSLKSFEGQLKPSKTITDFSNKVEKVGSISKRPKPFDQHANDLKTCHTAVQVYPTKPVDQVKGVRDSINTLTVELKTISDFETVSSFSDLKTLKSGFDTNGKTPEETMPFVQKARDDLESPKMKAFEEKVDKLHKELESLESVMKTYGTLSFDLAEVEAYQQNFLGVKDYLGMYTCLAQIDTKNSPMETAIEAIKDSRTFSVTAETQKAFKEFIKSKEYLPNVKSAADKLKNVQDQEKSILVGIFKEGKYSSVSKSLGLGVQGLLAIENVNAAQEKFKPLVANAGAISKHASLSKEQKENLSKLANLPNVFKSIDTFLQKNLAVSRRKRDVNFNSAASKLFEEAAQVVGVKIDMKHVREGLEALHTLDPNRFPAPFDELKTLDFDFSSYPFKEAGSSLATMDQFFVEYVRKIRSATPPPGKPIILPPNSPQTSANALTAKEAAKEKSGLEEFMENKPAFYGTISAAIVIILAFVGFVWYCCCCSKKKIGPIPTPPPKPDNGKVVVPISDTDASDDSSDEGDKVKGGKKEKKTKKKRSADNDEKKDDTSTEGPPTGGVSTPKGPVVEEKEKSLPLEKTQKNLEDAMQLISNSAATIYTKFYAGYTPTNWARTLLENHDNASNQVMNNQDMKYMKEQRRHCGIMLVYKTLAKLGPKYKGNNTFININEMPYRNHVLLMGQGPQDGTEKGGKLVDTREKQYHVFDNYDVRVVGQLCQFVEDGETKCGQYYPLVVNKPVKYGKYEVTTTLIIVDPPQLMNSAVYSKKDDFVLYKVKYKHDDDKVEKYVDILLCKGIPDHEIPKDHLMAIPIIEFLNSYNSSIFIHCSAGVGRTGSFAAIMCGIEMCNNQEVQSINDIIQHVRNHRGMLIQTEIQVLFVIRVIGEVLMRQRGVVQFDDLSKFDYYYREALKGTYDACDADAIKNKKTKQEELLEFMKKHYRHLSNHKKEAEEFMIKDRERLKEDKHPVKRGVNTTTEPEKKGNIQDDFIKQQADRYEKACEEGKEKMLVDEAKKEKDAKKADEKKSGEEVKKVKETKKSEQKNPDEKVKKSGEKDTKKKAASKDPGLSKEKGGAWKEKDGAGKKK